MKGIAIFLSSIFICISLVGCANNDSAKSNNSHTTFDESKAISMVIKDHPGFPSSTSKTVTKKLSTGGPPGSTRDVKFTTKVDKMDEATFVVTLTKDWGFSFGSEYVKTYWKYKVTSKSVTLVESIDKDYLPDVMK